MPNLNTQILGLTPANADMDDLEVGRRSKWGGGMEDRYSHALWQPASFA